MSSDQSIYRPKVPYENAPFSLCPGYKIGQAVTILVAITILVLGILGLKNVIDLGIDFPQWGYKLWVGAGVVGSVLTIFITAAFKCAYNDIYPQGNWKDFLKRNWSDFLGPNHEHFSNWEKQQKQIGRS